MKNIKFPTAQTILLLIAGLVTILTWLIPAGKYDTLSYNKADNTFTQTALEKTISLPGTQESLETLQIKIPLEKFTSGAIYKAINIPNTYKELKSKPQGLTDFIKSPIKGIIQASDIIFLVLILGGLIGIMNKSGAFDSGIEWLARKLKGYEFILIVLVTIFVAIGGTTFGLAEETIAFYPILIPVFLAAKYDAMVALASIYIGSCIGTMCSTVNPFSTIIASNAAGINWTTGLTGRLVMLGLGLVICIAYILRYAKRVKNDPKKSVIYSQKEAIENRFKTVTTDVQKLNLRLRAILFIFTSCFIVMIIGVSMLEWWFTEMAAVFLVGSVLIGVLAKFKESDFVDTFVKGAADLLGVALIIGIARGVSVIMEEGLISDTLLYYASHMTSGANEGVFANIMLFVYSGLSFFIPSSSGMAVLTMPIMSPLADSVGIGREIMVNCYQYGMGLFAFVNPTGLILASLAVVNVGFNKWLKFVTPLLIILVVFTMIVLTISVYL